MAIEEGWSGRSRDDNDSSHTGWNGRSRGGEAGYRFFIFLIRRAGVGAAYAFLTLVVPYFVIFAPRATAAVWFYNRQILHLGRARAAWGVVAHFYRFGQTIIDRIALGAGMEGRYRFEFDNYDEFLRILDSGRGVVMIGAHVGSWEAGSHFFGDYAQRMNIVLHDAEHAGIKRALQRNGKAFQPRVIEAGEGLQSVMKIKNALDAGEYVCFQGDRFVAGVATVEADFMGRRARFPLGPFRVAARMGVPVVFYYAMMERGRAYSFHFVEARTTEKNPRNSERDLVEQYIAATEAIVRRYPRQWFNFYRFWE